MWSSPHTITMEFLSPIWRPYYEIRSNTEAVMASSASSFSLSTLEIAGNPDMAGFALTERKQVDLWRWATVSVEGPVVDEGWETTQSEAKRSAIIAFRHVMAE
jgi:hypothetical protein